MGLLLREGEGYRWLLQGDVGEPGEWPTRRFFHSELVLRSGSGIENEDTWTVNATMFNYDGIRLFDTS